MGEAGELAIRRWEKRWKTLQEIPPLIKPHSIIGSPLQWRLAPSQPLKSSMRSIERRPTEDCNDELDSAAVADSVALCSVDLVRSGL